MFDILDMFAIVLIGIVGQTLIQVVAVQHILRNFFKGGNDGSKRLNFLGDHILKRDIVIFLCYPGVGAIIIEQGRAEIWITKFIEGGG